MAKIVSRFTGEEMGKGISKKALVLDNFGSLIGFRFDGNQGSAEVLMTFPELQRILEEIAEYEKSKQNTDEGALDALNFLRGYLLDFPRALLGNVILGQSHVKISPDPPSELPNK